MWFLWGLVGAILGGIVAFVGGGIYMGNQLPSDPTGGDEFIAGGTVIEIGLCGAVIGMLLGFCFLCWRRLYQRTLKSRASIASPVYPGDSQENVWPPPPNGS